MLPTPATMNGKSTRAMTSSTENGRRSGGGQSSPPGLEEVASILSGDWPDHMPPVDQLPPSTLRMLPTPTAQAAKHGSTPDMTANGFGSNLWDLPHLLPTPTAAGSGSTPESHLARKPGRTQVTDLTVLVEHGLIGASTPPPSTAGSAPSGDPHPAPPSPDPAGSPDCLPYSWNG